MDIQIGQRVRISNDAFPGSDEPADIAARGAEATYNGSLSEVFGMDETECLVVTTDDGTDHLVLLSEIEI